MENEIKESVYCGKCYKGYFVGLDRVYKEITCEQCLADPGRNKDDMYDLGWFND